MVDTSFKQQLNVRSRRFAQRLGWPGGIGVLLGVLALLELLTGALPAMEQTHEIETQIARLREPARSNAPIGPGENADAASQLDAFERFFPARSAQNESLKLMFSLSEGIGVELARGEYRLETDKTLKLTRYQLTLPVTGSYPAIKTFIGKVLQDIPSASIDTLSLQRRAASEELLEAVLRISFFNSPDAP